VACVGKILFTINEIGGGFLGLTGNTGTGHQLHRGSVTFGDGSNGAMFCSPYPY